MTLDPHRRHALMPPVGALPAGRVVLRRGTLAAAAGLGATLAVWAGAATWYILAKDDLAQRFLAHQTELRYVYEDRLASLKTQLEREVTLGLVERTGFARRADGIAARQSEIEARQQWLRAFAERSGGRAGEGYDATRLPPRPTPPVPAATADKPAPLAADEPRLRDRLSAVEGSLQQLAGEAEPLAVALAGSVRNRAGRLRAALDVAGIGPDRLAAANRSAQGGPLIPLSAELTDPGFGRGAAAAEAALADLERLDAAARPLPLARPLGPDAEPTSSFGYRVDPFTRSPALHSGLDFRAETGTPVRATGAGRVSAAEYAGGYGYMVEVDHGRGIVTRYGHLSAIGVTAGELVAVGQVVGRTGSTGRSTGPHLHYETRIDGEPVDPARFLEAARILASADMTGRAVR